MKLLCCVKCNQIFNLNRDYQECKGNHGGGKYVDNLNAKVWGNNQTIFVLGFANPSFTQALRDQIQFGDSSEMFAYVGGLTPKGREFTAFVIPDSANSIIWVDDKFE
jgi:hypothetical protein